MIAREGWPVIIVTALLAIVLFVVYTFTDSAVFYVLFWVMTALVIFHFFFFRDPDRATPQGDNLIVAPADGTIVKIEEVEEPDYFQGKVQKVSIFLSVFNVHVNRFPVGGKVDLVDYKKGRFVAAFADDASHANEQSVIGINSPRGKVLFKQIAGLIARRIIYKVEQGDSVEGGARFGMIRYGSRVDMFFPLDVKLHVQLKDKVRCGSTVIGEFV